MDNNIKQILELSRHPMLAVEKYHIIMANAAALRLLGGDVVGRSAVGLLPDQLFAVRGDEYVCSALINEGSYSASVRCIEGRSYISLYPLEESPRQETLLSEYVLNSALTSLFNSSIAINMVQHDLGDTVDERLEKHMAILNHSHFCLRHSLLNLNTALALQRNQLHFDRSSQDLSQLCSDLLSTVNGLIKKKGMSVRFSPCRETLPVRLDTDKTERIILNILCNSLQHSGADKISLRLERSESKAIISIDDNGCGIDPELMARIFSCSSEPLSAEGLRRCSTGGLGLNIARGLAQAQGGALIIESRPGVGTGVRILLPLDQSGIAVFKDVELLSQSCGMRGVLTELAWLLDSSFFTPGYLD